MLHRMDGILVWALVISAGRVGAYTGAATADRVTSLPGATSALKSNQFSGYLDVSGTRGIHYMYFESERNPDTDSVIFWTNGGPGCSGLLGLYTEFGPWRAGANLTLIRNPFSWTKFANIVFLEQPVGVGFSYSNPPIATTGYNDYMASKDNLLAVKAFFRRYPERARNDFYLSSESYGGHYIPQWTLQVLNDKATRVHFKGYLLGNPFTSYGAGSIAMANVLWGLQLVPQPLWEAFTAQGCESLFNSAYSYLEEAPECFDIMDALFTYIDHLNPYALEFATCTSSSAGASTAAQSSHTDHTTLGRRAASTLGAQAKVFLHMHARLKGTRAYQAYQAEQRRSRGAGAVPLQPSPVPADGTARMVGMADMTVLRERAGLSPSEYAAFTQEVHPGGESSQASGVATAEVSRRGTLSEESEFQYDPCTQMYTVEYLNSPAVQDALHVSTLPASVHQPGTTTSTATASSDSTSRSSSGLEAGPASSSMPDSASTAQTARTWDFCSDEVNGEWAFNDYLGDTTALYRTIYHHPHKPKNFKMLVYSGDVDGVCATIGTQHWIYNVTTTPATSLFKPWTYEDVNYGTQQGGYLTKFRDSLSFLTVRYAGHEVPAYQPQKALELLRRYLDGSLFDTSAQ